MLTIIICRLSQHLWRSHGIRVKSREGRILKHKTTHNTQINMDTDGSDGQDEIDISNEKIGSKGIGSSEEIGSEEIGSEEISNEDNTEKERKKEKLAEPKPNMENFSKWLKEEKKYSRKGVNFTIQTLHHLFKVTEMENLHEYLEQIRIKQRKATFKRKEWTATHYNEYWKEKEGETYWKELHKNNKTHRTFLHI